MAKSPISKTANLIIPIASVGIVAGLGYWAYQKFFNPQTDEEKQEEQIRQEKGAFQNTMDFIFGEKNKSPAPNDVVDNSGTQVSNGFFSPEESAKRDAKGWFGNLNDFLFGERQEGQTSPTSETQASGNLPNTTEPSGAGKTKPNNNAPKPNEDIQSPQGNKNKVTSSNVTGTQIGKNYTGWGNLQKTNKVFGTKPKRGGRITNFGAKQNTNSSNKDSSTNRKQEQSKKQVTPAPFSKQVSSFISKYTGKPAGTSATPSSSTSPVSSTSTSDNSKTQTKTPKSDGRSNRRNTQKKTPNPSTSIAQPSSHRQTNSGRRRR